MKYVSFPGLGIEAFGINSTAIDIGGLQIMWYGIIITLGMVLAYLYGLSRAKIEKVRSEDITDLTLFVILFGVLGARIYYILFELDQFIYTASDSDWENILVTLKAMVNIRGGGLAIYGGIIAGALTAVIFCRKKKIRIPVILDILAPSVMVGQIIGRWGNFMNVEAYGSETTLPWRMGVGFGGGAPYVHPTFLYESLWNLLGFVLITIFYKKKKFHGQIFLFYAIWYGAGRALIEGLRTDSLMLGPVRVSQIFSVVVCVAGIVLMILGIKRAPRVLRKTAECHDGDIDASDVTVEESTGVTEPAADTDTSPASETSDENNEIDITEETPEEN